MSTLRTAEHNVLRLYALHRPALLYYPYPADPEAGFTVGIVVKYSPKPERKAEGGLGKMCMSSKVLLFRPGLGFLLCEKMCEVSVQPSAKIGPT